MNNNENLNNNELMFDDEPFVVEVDYLEATSLEDLKKKVNKKLEQDENYQPEGVPFYNPIKNTMCQMMVYMLTEEELEELEEEENKKK